MIIEHDFSYLGDNSFNSVGLINFNINGEKTDLGTIFEVYEIVKNISLLIEQNNLYFNTDLELSKDIQKVFDCDLNDFNTRKTLLVLSATSQTIHKFIEESSKDFEVFHYISDYELCETILELQNINLSFDIFYNLDYLKYLKSVKHMFHFSDNVLLKPI